MLEIRPSEFGWTMYDPAGNIVASADKPGDLMPLATDLNSSVLAHTGPEPRLLPLVRELAQNYQDGLLGAKSAMDAIAAAVLDSEELGEH